MIRLVTVVVPVHDEEDLLGACLASLDLAGRHLRLTHPKVALRVLAVLDRCTDASPRIARREGVTRLFVDHGNVGATRSAGVRAGLDQATGAGVPPDRVWVATTDGDSRVPLRWLTEMVDLADAGMDLVVGTVEPDDMADPLVRARWHAEHHLTEGHPHVHGANLGFRGSAYLAVGGFRQQAVHEDIELVERLRERTDRWIATDRTRVLTSGRAAGRARGGFADYLAGLAPALTPATAPQAGA